MPRVVTCPLGHHWEVPANGGAAEKAACPVCGITVPLAATDTSIDGLEVLRVQVARLQQPLTSESPTLAPVPPLSDGAAPAPLHVAGYEIVGELGRGGMGVVYKAVQTSLKRLVALKMLLPGAYCGDEERSRFRTEAEAAAKLQHPNIVQIYEIGEAGGRPYFSMEFVEGGNLAGRLGGTPMPSREAARLLEVLARAVHNAHERGVIHRDLKPANILLAGDGSPKITDFGLAKHLGRDTGQTQYGAIMGTPSYMAPEQVGGKGRDVSAATDVYSLGAILYELLTGRPPFRAATPLDTVLQVLSEEPLPPSRLQPRVARDLETICLKCLNKDPRKRYATTRALAEDLHRYINRKPILARPVPWWEHVWKWARRRPAAAALTVLLTLTAGSAVYGVIYGVERHRQRLEARVARQDLTAYYQSVRLAQKDWQDDEVGSAAAELADCAKDLRNWEWRYLEHQCNAGLLTLNGGGLAVALDPQGRRVAAGGSATVWDISTGKQLLTLGETGGPGRKGGTSLVPAGPAVAWSPDGKWLVAPSASDAIDVWDAASGKLLYRLEAHGGKIRSLAFSGDSDRLICGSADGIATVWAMDRRRLVASLPDHRGGVDGVALSKDGVLAATTAHDGTLRLWDVGTAKARLTLPADGDVSAGADEPAASSLRAELRGIHPVALSPGGTLLLYGRGTEIVRLELPSGRELRPLAGGHREAVRCLAFSPDGRRLASGGADRAVVVWDPRRGQPLFRLRGHHDAVNGVAFSGDGRLLASTGFDNSVRLWDASTDPEARTLVGPSSVRSLTFTSAQQLLAAGDDGVLRTWSLDAVDRLPSQHFADAAGARAVACSRAGQRLAAGFADGSIRVWKTGGALLFTTRRHGGPVSALSFNSDGSRLASASLDGTVCIWDTNRGESVRTFTNHRAPVYAVCFGRGSTVASGGADLQLRIWNADSGEETFALGGHAGPITCVVFSNDGERLASGSIDGMVKLWSPGEGRELGSFQGCGDAQGNPDPVRALAFTPDGTRLASAGDDDTIRLWEVLPGSQEPTCHEMLTLRARSGAILALAFSPDGDRLASAGSDGNVRIWDASPVTTADDANP